MAFMVLLLIPAFSSIFAFGNKEGEGEEWVIDFDINDSPVSVADNITQQPSDDDKTEEHRIEQSEDESEQHYEEGDVEIEVSESGDFSKEDMFFAEESDTEEPVAEESFADEIIKEYLENVDETEEDLLERDYTQNYDDYEFDPEDWRLRLINKSHFIPDDYEFPLGSLGGYNSCDKRVIPDLVAMLAAAREDGVNLSIASPYRMHATQIMLYDNKITKFMNTGMTYLEAYKLAGQAVTIPGASEHEAGLCFDIISDDYHALNEGFSNTRGGQWLEANAHYYGFILRYPKDKEYITTIEFEPWHFRYVGVEAASVMYKENLTLEEFWEKYLEE
ncbi:MAG: D-alanyl-D-alanine carboxypeptidase family protein [Lachnospiraceae bacterium]|nr:D-alanyl-D-alanine carboxypeptidase family protein [Lachnospiraceae bacterium]